MLSHFALRLRAFLNDEDGPTAVEYGIMMALIIIACVATLTVMGTNSNNTYNKVATTVKVSGS